MLENKCCGNCENYYPNSNIDGKCGICKEYEVFTYYNRPACNWYFKKEREKND